MIFIKFFILNLSSTQLDWKIFNFNEEREIITMYDNLIIDIKNNIFIENNVSVIPSFIYDIWSVFKDLNVKI